MEKRYQVFISSTFADLREERRGVTQTIMELDCIPAGMELFPAVDEEQWAFIQRVIEDCDYYVLIIGGRYGSMSSEGVSYTEKEYDYALARGLPVLAFIHSQPEQLPLAKSELDATARGKLEKFRERAAHGRLVKFWTKPEELPGLVALSLPKTIKAQPRTGWVRATAATSYETLSELNDLRKKVSELESEISRARSRVDAEPLIDGLAPLTEGVRLSGDYFREHARLRWSSDLRWLDAFAIIGPSLLSQPSESSTRSHLAHLLFRRLEIEGSNYSLDAYDFDTLKIQLAAHGLVQFKRGGADGQPPELRWILTQKGLQLLFESRTVRSVRSVSDGA